MSKPWAVEKIEEKIKILMELRRKEKEFGTHPSRQRKIIKVEEEIESWKKILKNQNGWSKRKIVTWIKTFEQTI